MGEFKFRTIKQQHLEEPTRLMGVMSFYMLYVITDVMPFYMLYVITSAEWVSPVPHDWGINSGMCCGKMRIKDIFRQMGKYSNFNF